MTNPTPRPAMSASNNPVAECRTVLVDFLAAIDHGHATTALDLFTDDASFAARGQQLHGRDAIRGFLTDLQADTERHTVHVVTNEIARRVTDDEVDLDALVVRLVRQPAGYVIEGVLDTSQTLPRTPTGWRIAHRATRPVHTDYAAL